MVIDFGADFDRPRWTDVRIFHQT